MTRTIAEELTDLSAKSAEKTNSERKEAYEEWLQEWKRLHGPNARPKRNPFPPVRAIDYSSVDFRAVIGAADKLWSFYFCEDDICRDRMIVSIDCALAAMDGEDAKTYGVVYFNGYAWSCAKDERGELRARLEAEKAELVRQGHWPADIEALKESLRKRPSCTINDMLSGEPRILVMICLFSRLLVHTAVEYPELWANRNELFAIYTHMLEASNRKFELPFPWHLDIASGGFLRTGRSHYRQTNVVDEIIDARFVDESERAALAFFVAHYLARSKNSAVIVKAIEANAKIKSYFSDRSGNGRLSDVLFIPSAGTGSKGKQRRSRNDDATMDMAHAAARTR